MTSELKKEAMLLNIEQKHTNQKKKKNAQLKKN